MITKERLLINLHTLKGRIPRKPAVYTTDFPKTMKEGLNIYSNTRSVNSLMVNVYNLNKLDWPLPLWVDPENIKIGFWNTYYWKKWHNSWPNAKKFDGFEGFNWLWAPIFGDTFSETKIDKRLIRAFDVNRKYYESKLMSHPLFFDKKDSVVELLAAYKNRNYVSCINIIFPLIDFIVRAFLKTTNLSLSVTKICNLFKDCGFDFASINQLMPNVAHNEYVESKAPLKLFDVMETDEYKTFVRNLEMFDFKIIGAGLNSFLWFSNSYYAHYKDDLKLANTINRHGILHGSVNHYGNMVNSVKLLTYLYLLLEMESVLEILFDE